MAQVRRLAVMSVLAAVLCGPAAASAAENKPAAKAPSSKASPKAAPTASPAPKAAPVPAPSEAAHNPAPGDEAGPSDVMDGDSKDSDAKGSAAGLPVPRFVSLRTNPINLRTGPGVRYPVDWVYVRRHLPVEVIGEFDTWRRIRDHDGSEGWVHQSMLSGKRTAVVTGGAQTLKRTGEDTAVVVATLEAGVIVNVQRCPAETGFCRVEVDGVQGWLKREQLWGIYPGETVQ